MGLVPNPEDSKKAFKMSVYEGGQNKVLKSFKTNMHIFGLSQCLDIAIE